MSLEAAQAHFGVIQRMKIGVRTGFGESKDHYGGNDKKLFSGLRQRNGASAKVKPISTRKSQRKRIISSGKAPVELRLWQSRSPLK